jgi:DNA-binding MarR family transcriptional regulator
MQHHAIAQLGRELSDATLRLHQAIAQKAGLTGTDHKYLGLLTRYGPMTAGELGRRSGLTSGAITGLVDRLEAKALVARRAEPDDRRKILIVPHAANIKKLLGASSAELERRIVAHVKTLSAKDAEVVENYLRETVAILNELSEKFQEAKESSKEGR